MEDGRARLTPKLVDSLYVEAMVLADEARSYFDRVRNERLELDPLVRVAFSCESLKVTTRLMHIVAWLLNQRAVEAGEIARAGAREQRLSDAPVSDLASLSGFPAGAVQIIETSQDLYARVRRLDEGSEAEPQASPARSLMSLLERSL